MSIARQLYRTGTFTGRYTGQNEPSVPSCVKGDR
jgi:hypothetical protein